MFRNDIAVIRAVQSDRIQRQVLARVGPAVAPRDSRFRAVRRSVGRSIVRFGAAVAADGAAGRSVDLAGSR
jgi:hypothetical protein